MIVVCARQRRSLSAMMLGVVFLAATLLGSVSGQGCGGSWLQYGNMCYLVGAQNRFWTSAREACKDEHADLVVIPSADVNNFLQTALASTQKVYWIGLWDRSQESSFEWVDGSPVTYTNWKPGEPNDDFPISTGEDCGEIDTRTGGNGKWNDQACVALNYYICSRSISTPVYCDQSNGWRSANNKCYLWVTDSYQWSGAEQYCSQLGSHLVSFTNADEQTAVEATTARGGLPYFIGLTDRGFGRGNYQWTDGTTFNAALYNNWDANQPDNQFYDINGGNCVQASYTGKWTTIDCTTSRFFFCERIQGACAPGWMYHNGQCYQLNINNPKTWTDAKHYCDAQAGYLTTIINDAENQYITGLLSDFDQAGVSDIYIGISDSITDNTLKWVQETGSSYVNWATGQPTMRSGQLDCGSIYTGGTSGKWESRDCFNLQGFICKIAAGQTVSLIPPDITTGSCDAGWDLHGDSCYYFSPQETSSWNSAETLCSAMGPDTHLVSIHSAEEQSFLSVRASFVEESHWIGLHDTVGESTFTWTDGSPTDFLNWGPGEPNNVGSGEDCVHLESAFQKVGIWNDINCDYQYRYICKKPKTGSNVNTPAPPPTTVYDMKCGLGWEYEGSGDRCYSYRTETKNWYDADTQCRLEGAHLISIADFNEQLYVYTRASFLSTGAVWIGANDVSLEGGFRWTDGSPFRYINWAGGEPNNDGVDGENCGELYTGDGKWNDNKCDTQRMYACKQSAYIQTYFIPSRLRKLAQSDATVLNNIWPEDCAAACVQRSTCRSFDYGRNNMECRLNTRDSANGLIPTDDFDPFDYYERDFTATTDMPPTSVPPTYNCPSDDWLPYGDNCYRVQQNTADYNTAQTLCQMMGGANLASIANMNENNFVMSALNQVLTYQDEQRAWLGMSDLNQEMYYEWLDGSDVTFTNWAYYEPNNSGNEDCVEMYLNDGQWNDSPCTGFNYPSVCKIRKGPSGTPPLNTGCQSGWQAYLGSCYKFETTPRSWNDAQTNCASMGGHLASVSHIYDAGYVSSQVGLQTHGHNVWIGLSTQATAGLYEWIDGSSVTYSNWGQLQPDASSGRCVSINSGAPAAGYWYNTACSSALPYVCESNRPGYTTMAPPGVVTNPTNIGCQPGWIGYTNHCFKIYEANSDGERLTWNDARTFCKELTDNSEGDLAAYHSPEEETYIINSFLAQSPDNAYGYWIGLNDQVNEGGFEWSDGSAVEYENWGSGEPNNAGGNENCGEAFLNPGRGWNDIPCDAQRHWICGVEKNVPVRPPTTPFTKKGCPSTPDWYLKGSNCYYVSLLAQERRDWNQAEEFCHERGGHLASIHSEDDNNYILNLIGDNLVGQSYWIGLREYAVEGDYKWCDGSAVDYTRWRPNEPNDGGGSEQCAELKPDGTWNDENCGEAVPFICMKSDGSTGPVTHAPTTPKEGGCMDGWIKMGSKCYQIFDEQKDMKTFDEARQECRKYKDGELVTIPSHDVQSLLTALMYFYPTDVWIGLSDRGAGLRFYWVDGGSLEYTNWMSQNPSLLDDDGDECVKMSRNPIHPGVWDDVLCDDKYGYACMMDVDPQYDYNPDIYSDCKQGYFSYGTSCFKLFNDQPLSFAEAKAKCQAEMDGIYLASVKDNFEKALVETMMAFENIDQMWIGMELDRTTHRYGWVDGWPVLFSAWGENEPSGGDGEGCVMTNADGRWDDTLCTAQKPFICKYDSTKPPSTVVPPKGYCPDGWKAFGQDCYMFDPTYTRGSFQDAKVDCEGFGAQLASIHSEQENSFIKDNVAPPTLTYGLWIGLQKGQQGLEWTDGTPVDFVFWKEGEPNSASEMCVEMYPKEYGLWNDEQCTDPQDYVCKMPQMTNSTKEPQVTKSAQTGGMNTGAIVGIVLGILVLVLLVVMIVVFVLKRNSLNTKAADANAASTPETPVGFDNALYISTSDKASIVAEA
ncbi:macrophage mannose receptor 1-like [Patiria miniata]|uniref:Macrophage mannose receptor 1-like n=1 Tax=Patiria miniata TaxID=46514 RepID=A0A914BSH0_PATMI|nr:macrophage mannose receptor 1-like [Patiria miniata]